MPWNQAVELDCPGTDEIRKQTAMAEVLAVVGVVSSIVSLVDFGSKVLHRLNDFQSSCGEIPETFKQELPILLATLDHTKVAVEKGSIKEETRKALSLVVNECQTQITLLDNLITDLLPQEDDSWRKKARKAIFSLCQDAKVNKITTIL
jgi:NACHT NTPase-like protein